MIRSDGYDRTELERLQYRQGQTLLSRDGRDQAAIDSQLRWWHNRALHRAYGVAPAVAEALAVVHDTAAHAVTVGPGLAYDVFGRDLILARPRSVPDPVLTTIKDWTLVASWRACTSTTRISDLAGPCAPGGAPAELAEMAIAWQPSAQVTPRDGVFLAFWKAGQFTTEGRSGWARPLALPHMVSGSTISGATTWQSWPAESSEDYPLALGAQVDIDTSSAGFTTTPCYFAWLNGPEAWGPAVGNKMVLFFSHIEAETAVGFRFRLLMVGAQILNIPSGSSPTATSSDFGALLRLALRLQLSVYWLGIEPHRGVHRATLTGGPLQ
jgi:hypothetical protein